MKQYKVYYVEKTGKILGEMPGAFAISPILALEISLGPVASRLAGLHYAVREIYASEGDLFRVMIGGVLEAL